ncbi:MAG TPA: hypothetical protein VM347_35335 [Nonomuraea sp.]|nr:hypothetical protein [Nonomuraea sp.]
MIERGSLVVFGSALVAALVLPQGFTMAAQAARSQARAGATALSARLDDPCENKGHGCSKGYSDGYADGVRCQAAQPGGHPDSGQPDYGYGYDVGWAAGRKHAGCGGGGSSGRAQLRQQGESQGASDANTYHQCVKKHFKGMPKPFKRGYRSANPYC